MAELVTPVITIAQRVKELRGRRGWTAADLGTALHKHGVQWDRFTVASLENGKRQNVTVKELLALALALDVAPVNLLVPLDNRAYLLPGNRTEDSDDVRAWFRGKVPLPGVDERTFLAEASVRDLWEQRHGKEPESLAFTAARHGSTVRWHPTTQGDQLYRPERTTTVNTTSWGRSLADAEVPPPCAGDAIPETSHAAPPPRCRGTRTIAAIIPLQDAVLLDDRLCPGCADCADLAEQQLAEAVARARQVLAGDVWHAPEGVEP
jgi:transcriptional regulator with XRE-family HTH domain